MFEEINEIAGFKITDFEILDVVDDLVYVRNNNSLCGVLDLSGNVVIDILFDSIKRVSENLFICYFSDGICIYDLESKEKNIVPSNVKNINYIGNNYFKSNKDDFGIVCIIDEKGKVVKRIRDFQEMKINDDNIILNGCGYRHSLYNKNFNKISNEYEHISLFNGNYAICKSRCYPYFGSSFSIYGIIDNKGIEILKPKYKSLSFIDGNLLMAVDKKNRVKIIDTKGKTIKKLNLKCEELDCFINNTAFIYNENNANVIDNNGNYIIKDNYRNIKRISSYYLVQDFNLLYGLIDNKGNLLLDVIYSSIEIINDNLFILKKDFKNIIMKDENIVYESNDKVLYKDNYFYTSNVIINNNFKELFKYQGEVIDIKDNYFVILNNNHYILLDNTGNKILESDNKIYIISSDNIIIDNKIVNINQEYLKYDYKLKIYYEDRIIINRFESKEARDEYKKKLSIDDKKSKIDLITEKFDLLIDLIFKTRQEIIDDLNDSDKSLRK